MLLEKRKKNTRVQTNKRSNFSRQIVSGILRLLLIVAVVSGIYYVTHIPAFAITTVVVEGGQTVSHEVLKAKVLDELKGSYLHLIPKNFIYFYPHDYIIETLEKSPRVYNVQIAHTGLSTIVVSFEEYVPFALFCAGTGGQCYFMDATGFAFEEAPQLVGNTFVRYTQEKQAEVTRGAVMDGQKLKDAQEFIERAENELHFRIATVLYTEVGDIEFGINGGGKILASGQKDLHTTFENVLLVLKSDEFKHIKAGNFQYIDVRFPPKIFVNESLETTNASTSAATST